MEKDMMRWALLEQLIKKRDWKVGAELGVWQGKTYKHLLKQCNDLTLIGVDLYQAQPDNKGPETWTPGENGHMWEHERYYRDITQFRGKIGERAKFIRATTVEAAEQVEDESLDFVFIDADHSYEAVKRDIDIWEKKVKPGGCVLGHDIDWPDVRKAVKEKYGNLYACLDDNVWCKCK
jgi:hypothetical protein